MGVGLAVAGLTIGWTLRAALARTGGLLVYALDDAYIHMALARNLAEHGTWSVDSVRFAPASSSPLWTVLLALTYRLAGAHGIVSLLLNVGATVLLLAIVYRVASETMPPSATAALLVAVTLLAPIPTLVLEGMEHVLQSALDVAFVWCAVRVITTDEPGQIARRALVVLAPLVAAIRYEGIFLVAIVAAALALRRRWRDALLVSVIGAAPVIAMAWYSVAHGGFIVPSSVLVKSQGQGLPESFTVRSFVKSAERISFALSGAPHMLVLLLASSLIASLRIARGEGWRPEVTWNAVFIAVSLLHLQFAAIGWFYRYESYLVILGLVAVATSLHGTVAVSAGQPFSRWMLMPTALTVLLALQPLLWRAYTAITDTPAASEDIFRQQVQMARFVDRYYPARRVALNDIGAVAFLSRAQVVDLVGLADVRVARAKLQKRYNGEFISGLAAEDNIPIAIVYDSWLARDLPARWRRVGQWSIPNPVVAGPTISFYATGEEEEKRLVANLREFSASLPPQVMQSGVFTDGR